MLLGTISLKPVETMAHHDDRDRKEDPVAGRLMLTEQK